MDTFQEVEDLEDPAVKLGVLLSVVYQQGRLDESESVHGNSPEASKAAADLIHHVYNVMMPQEKDRGDS